MTLQDAEGRSCGGVSDGSEIRSRAISPDVAFKIIGNETRLAALDALWGPTKPGTMGFADLRKAVGMRDSSQFNFHLKKLVDGGFVEKIDDTYSIRQAGARVICTLRTGYLTDHPELEPFQTTGRCYACDAPLEARYDDEMYIVACSGCERLHTRGWFPPSLLTGRTPEEALLVGERAMRASIALTVAGICSVCNGTTVRTLSRGPSDVPVLTEYVDPERDGGVRDWYVCSHCSAWVTRSPGDAVIDHPAVVALYSDHGTDVRSCPRWELPWTIDASVLEVVSGEPFRVRLTVALEGEKRVLTLDEAFEVVSVE
jgi:DNA-binding transcriptional ArsR family regulator